MKDVIDAKAKQKTIYLWIFDAIIQPGYPVININENTDIYVVYIVLINSGNPKWAHP